MLKMEKISTFVGIFIFMSIIRLNSCSLMCWHFNITERYKFNAQLSLTLSSSVELSMNNVLLPCGQDYHNLYSV